MKIRKILFAAILTAMASMPMDAQRVYEQIYDAAYMTATNTREDRGVRKIASFRVDAINYLKTKTLEQLIDTTRHLSNVEIAHLNNQLDSMAFYMHDYINLFLREYARAYRQKNKERVLKIFRSVSINTPLYNDPNKEYVLAYYNREDYLTQFSLDTDWVKASAIVRQKLKE